jgi:hypothetical protein
MHSAYVPCPTPMASGRAILAPPCYPWPALDTLEPPPSAALLSAGEAGERLREIVEQFFFRRLRTEHSKPIGRLLIKSPPGLGKTTQAIKCAIRYQAEQERKDGCRLFIGDFNEAGVPAQTSIFVRTLSYVLDCDAMTMTPMTAPSAGGTSTRSKRTSSSVTKTRPPVWSSRAGSARRTFRARRGWARG